MRAVSRWIADVTQPNHQLFHPVQLFLCGSFSYLGTSCFLSTLPKDAMAVTMTAYVVSQLTSPFFSSWLTPYKVVNLVPLAGQVAHLIFSFYSANFICRLVGKSISMKAVAGQMLLFLTTVSIMRIVLRRFRRNIAS